MVDRELGTLSVFSQRETGASGPHKDQRVHPAEARREFQDNGFGQLDRGARLVADAVKATLRDIETGTPERETAYQPFVTDFDVATVSQRFAPPATRPYPGVSKCNTAALFHGDPRLPILGLPDCQSTNATEPLTPVTAPMYDQLKRAGVPVPESYSATALTAVEETAAVHLMAIRLGDIVATVCPCEQFTDTALNIESRLDSEAGKYLEGLRLDADADAGGPRLVRARDGGRHVEVREPAGPRDRSGAADQRPRISPLARADHQRRRRLGDGRDDARLGSRAPRSRADQGQLHARGVPQAGLPARARLRGCWRTASMAGGAIRRRARRMCTASTSSMSQMCRRRVCLGRRA